MSGVQSCGNTRRMCGERMGLTGANIETLVLECNRAQHCVVVYFEFFGVEMNQHTDRLSQDQCGVDTARCWIICSAVTLFVYLRQHFSGEGANVFPAHVCCLGWFEVEYN